MSCTTSSVINFWSKKSKTSKKVERITQTFQEEKTFCVVLFPSVYDIFFDHIMSISSSSVIRPYPYREHRQGLNHILSDIERTRHASRERHFNRLYCRSPSIQRFHRIQQLRRRQETHHRQFIAADNAARLLSDDLRGPQPRQRASEEERSAESTGTNDTTANGDDSVLIVDEVKSSFYYYCLNFIIIRILLFAS